VLDDAEGAQRMGEAGRRRVASGYSAEAHVAATVPVYETAIAAWSGRAGAAPAEPPVRSG
jgi:hypothetical protein